MPKSQYVDLTSVKTVMTKDFHPNKPLNFQLNWKDLKVDHPYFADRGLLPETVAAFGLGFVVKGVLKNRVAIPIHGEKGELVAYACRWPGEPPDGTPKYKFTTGFKRSLELFNLIRSIHESIDQPLIIVEGFFDCMKLWQCGLKRVVALMGSTLSVVQEELIRKHTDSRSQVIVMLNEDGAGRAGREDIVQRLAPWLFIKAHVFERAGQQSEHLTIEKVAALFN